MSRYRHAVLFSPLHRRRMHGFSPAQHLPSTAVPLRAGAVTPTTNSGPPALAVVGPKATVSTREARARCHGAVAGG